jgi:transcription elongation GreA/GreB family factor
MKDPHDVFLSIPDAARLAAVLRASEASPSASHATDELASLLAEARVLAPDRLPSDRAAIGSSVTYRDEPAGVERTIALSPRSALSPIGLALLGRKPGSLVMGSLANGWPFTVRVLAVAPLTEKDTS